MHTIAVVHALLGIASLLAHRRCLIDSPVRSHARLRWQHSCDLGPSIISLLAPPIIHCGRGV